MKIKRISVLLIAAALTLPMATANAADRYIKVSADGSVKVVPDAVRLTATVTLVADSSKVALSSANKVSAEVRKALTGNGVAAKYISTTSITTYPEYNYSQDKGSTLIGYRASQSFNVVIRNANNSGAIVDAVVAAGGDNLNLSGVSPFVMNNAAATAAARKVAVRNATTKARSYANLVGGSLGAVQFIEESSSPSLPVPMMASAKVGADSTQVDLGEQEITVSILAKFALN